MKLIKKTFCTIVTPDYLSMAITLYDSILENGDVSLSVLLTCNSDNQTIPKILLNKKIKLNFLDEILNFSITNELYNKYYKTNLDAFRWSMKSVYIDFLLSERGYDKVIFVDPDIYFFDSYDFLFELLNDYDIVLTPHWRTTNPEISPINFTLNFKDGLFNGGFVGFNKYAINSLKWWSKVCLFNCKKEYSNGFFVDQKYLDIFPVLFDNVLILKHKGCNVANWNIDECKRIKTDAKVLINNRYPIVFIHFTKSTINGIINGQDSELNYYLYKYYKNLKKNGFAHLKVLDDYFGDI